MSFMEEHGAELHQIFLESSQELVQSLNEEALRLERDPQEQEDALRNIRRIVHTLKGDSAACGLTEFSDFAHNMEAALQQTKPTKAARLVMEAADGFSAMLREVRERGSFAPTEPKAADNPAAAASAPFLRVDAARVDALMELTGELLVAKLGLQQAIAEFNTRFSRDPLALKLNDAFTRHARVLAELQQAVLQVRMVDVGRLFRRMPRVLRDAAQQSGKQATLEVRGAETRLDRSVLDALAEPLMHLVRNAVDHGIEPPEVRRQMGKPESGTITLSAVQQANHVVISISDDGRGLDAERLRACAIERGMMTAEEAAHLSEQQAYALIFEPGFSTAEKVSSISGRGIGMDVVKSVVERVSGSVQSESSAGIGTIFRLQVPLTLAMLRALLVEAAGCTYAVPVSAIIEIMRVTPEDVLLEDGRECIRYRQELLRLVRMGPGSGRRFFAVAVAIGAARFALAVDRLHAEENLVIKGMSDPLIATESVSGAAILGDGRVVMVLNLLALFQRAESVPATGGSSGAEAQA